MFTKLKKDTLNLSKYFVSLPHPAISILLIIAISFIFGILIGIAKEGFRIEAVLAGFDGLFILALPSIISGIFLFIMRRRVLFKRAIFLSLLSVILYGIFYFISVFGTNFLKEAKNFVYFGFALSFVVWYFILLLGFNLKRSAIVFSAAQLLIFALFASFFEALTETENFHLILIKIYLTAFVLLAIIYAIFYLVSAPMKKNLGISSLDAISMFAAQWLYGKKDLEETFYEFGEEIETLVWIGKFSGKRQALFVVPYVHFGPFGNLGGSEFTQLISEAIKENYKKENYEVFVFHGTVTHDFNPVSSNEINKLISACKKVINQLNPKSAKMSYSCYRFGTVKANAFCINESAFISYSRAPRTTEDVNFGIGLTLMEIGKRIYKSVAVVDEHNAETGDVTSVEIGNPIGFEMISATEKLFDKKEKQEKFLFGFSSGNISLPSLGKNGIKLALFKQGKKLYAIALFDSNGIIPQFRAELVEFFEVLGKEKGLVCKGEIYTTDTHQINNIRGILNPIGTENRGEIMMLLRKLFYEAYERLEEVKFDSGETKFKINVFGPGQSVEIVSTISSVIAILKLIFPAILILAAIILVFLLEKI